MKPSLDTQLKRHRVKFKTTWSRQRKKQALYLSQGRCPKCGSDAEGRYYCHKHMVQMREWQRARKLAKRKNNCVSRVVDGELIANGNHPLRLQVGRAGRLGRGTVGHPAGGQVAKSLR